MSPPPLKVAIAGLGTVGGGVAQILHTHRALLAQRCGRAIQLVAVADQRPFDKLATQLDAHGKGSVVLYNDAMKMANDSDADVIVETIGGYKVALDVARLALQVLILLARSRCLSKHHT